MTMLSRQGRSARTAYALPKEPSLDLHARVVNALHWSLAIPRNKIDVEVESDWVTLRGVVTKTYEKSCAEALAQRVPGVAGVRNEIEVRPETSS
ncbi:BON domain-containing protein [Roseiarcus fermentans]|uniref:BON domain-containing protein n=1 Tax=Roseiarcus fermentans TaxID=1473586 RepID=A0A366FR14_9HYPH|nr:BON domain-containing protein [Roseiarcus fermentans]RBP16165.1 BON domain-containing protein [Roseiarcus fermentans]